MSTNLELAGLPGLSKVDRTALRVNQTAIATFVLAAFLLNLVWLVIAVAVVMALGTISPALAVFQRFYRDILRPAGLLRPDIHEESAAPHRFAQGMGATVLGLASVALLSGAATLGWALALLVGALAAVNVIFGFCAGCFIFFQIQKVRRA